MNPFKAIDIFIGRRLYPIRVKLDAKAYRAIGFSEPEALAKIIYKNRAKAMWKPYGITLKDIRPIVDRVCEVKPLHGIKLWIGLRKATLTIQTAIKQKRIVFLDTNKVAYTDKDYLKRKMNLQELAEVFIEKTQMGFTSEQIVQILEREYKRSRK